MSAPITPAILAALTEILREVREGLGDECCERTYLLESVEERLAEIVEPPAPGDRVTFAVNRGRGRVAGTVTDVHTTVDGDRVANIRVTPQLGDTAGGTHTVALADLTRARDTAAGTVTAVYTGLCPECAAVLAEALAAPPTTHRERPTSPFPPARDHVIRLAVVEVPCCVHQGGAR